MALPLAVVRSWVEQAVFLMGQTSRCCMVCLMPQSQVSVSFEYPHFGMFTLDRPTCVRNRLSAFQVVQGFSAPAGRCSSALTLRCTLAFRGSSRSLHNSMRAASAVVLMGSVHLIKLWHRCLQWFTAGELAFYPQTRSDERVQHKVPDERVCTRQRSLHQSTGWLIVWLLPHGGCQCSPPEGARS